MPILRLALPTPLRQLFDYLPLENSTEAQIQALQAGIRFRVPLGSREVVGYLVSVEGESGHNPTKIRRVLEQLDTTSLLTAPILALCQWAQSYYRHPPGEVYAAAFPNRLRQGKPPPQVPPNHWRLTGRGKGLPEGALKRSPKQALTLTLLQENALVSRETLANHGVSSAVLRALKEKGLAEPAEAPVSSSAAIRMPALPANKEQTAALAEITPTFGHFACHLVDGVTGSGKTEVYLQLIAECMARSEQALVLIPEIGLTPQTLRRFSDRFEARIEVFHSGLSDTERYQAWEAARTGRAHIIIGTRSAVFTPLEKLGLIVVDEEHDAAFKQQDGFRYSARDVAIKRAQLEQCPVILGSATPSLESLRNAAQGRYSHQRLTHRAGNSSLPAISTADIRGEALQGGLGERLIRACEGALARGEQVLLFLNRRGYAPSLICHDCGWIAQCRACDARLTVHRRQRQLRCHHCGASQTLVQQCPECRGAQLLTNGLGTEQTEETLNKRFPGVTIHRVDSDSVQGRATMGALVEEINRGEPCILLGTQMLTKGHHFPRVSLIGVIDADALLFSADFRGEERMAQLLTQVAGRAGREDTLGEVLLQTHYPDHPAVQAMVSQSYAEQAQAIMTRRAETGMPPFGQLLVLRVDSDRLADGEAFLHQLRRRVSSQAPTEAVFIGPLPAALSRRAGKFRSQLLVSAPSRKAIQQCAQQLVTTAEHLRATRGLKWSIDIDPLEVL